MSSAEIEVSAEGSSVGIAPVMTVESEPFWKAIARGQLVVERCLKCEAYVFPPRGVCARCWSRNLEIVAIEGSGRIHSFTVNHNPWLPGMEVPYVLALVEFLGYPGFRVLGRLRGGTFESIAIGEEVCIGSEPGPAGFSIPSFARIRAIGD